MLDLSRPIAPGREAELPISCSQNKIIAMPKVSAIICVYNQPLVKDAIESVLAQTFPDLELIIIDDGSTDQTPEIIAAYSDRAKIRRQKNKGVAAARNRGLSIASGEIIAFLDADDVWMPQYLSEQIAFLSAHKECGLSFTDGWMLWKKEIPDNILRLPSHYSIYPPAAGPNAAATFFDSPIITSFTAFPRSYFERVGFFAEDLKVNEDAEMFLRGFEQAIDFGFINKPLAIKRNLDTGLARNSDQSFYFSRIIQLMSWRRSGRLHPLLREGIPIADRQIARTLLAKGDPRQARKYLFEALRFKPWAIRTFLIWAALFLPEPVPAMILTKNLWPAVKKKS